MNSYIYILKNKYLPFLFAVPLFFCFLRYDGIVIDAVLYVTQYVFSIDPVRFLGDPAFEFGNQESFGLFSAIFWGFIELFGVAKGAFAYTISMQFAWIVVAVFLVKSLLSLTKQRLWILPVTILLVAFFANGVSFSQIRFFKCISPYACSRALSIVFGIGAITLIFYQKKFFSLILILIGTIIHPLTAGWCLPFWMFYYFPKSRIPVAVVSALFPLTILFHVAPFDSFPVDWLPHPLDFRPRYEELSRYFMLIAFWGILAKHAIELQIKKISSSLCLITSIALYWDVWGGYVGHILLYQVQPWRVFWLSSILAAPLGICLIKDSFRRILKNKRMTHYDFALIILIVGFILPENIVITSLVAIYLSLNKTKIVSLNEFIWIFVTYLFGAYGVQQYYTWCLQGFPAFLGFDFRISNHIMDSYLVYQIVVSIGFIIFFFRKHHWVSALLLAFSIIFPRFMLLPVLSLYLAFFPKQNRVRYWCGAIVVLSLLLFDGLIDVETRRLFLIDNRTICFPWVFFTIVASFASIYLFKRISYFSIVIWILTCSIIAMVSYNEHSTKDFENEMQLDLFLHNPIFPQIKERGKILFFVSGPFVKEPRLQFMTGSYFSHSTMVGSIFNRNHHREALRRSHLLYQKTVKEETGEIIEFSKIVEKMADVDTLIDRVSFLCGRNEIAYLVTDKEYLPFLKGDSAIIGNSQKVFLYECISEE